MFRRLDWSEREEHMWERHAITPEQAEEALDDDSRVVFEPDYASQSGRSVRVIGFAPSVGEVLTVIVVVDENGKEWGGSAWRSNRRDVAYYTGTMEGDADEQGQ